MDKNMDKNGKKPINERSIAEAQKASQVTSRERLLKLFAREIPDCVPVDIGLSDMIPARMTGKPFWDVYLYQDPPLWKANIEAIKYFGYDGGIHLAHPAFAKIFNPDRDDSAVEERIVHRDQDESFVTQKFDHNNGIWSKNAIRYTRDNPPASILPEKLGLPSTPSRWEKISGIRKWPEGIELWDLLHKEMGSRGILTMPSGCRTCLISSVEDVYSYYDDPGPWRDKSRLMLDTIRQVFDIISRLDTKPDLLHCGGSGSLVFQTPQMFEELALPPLVLATELAAKLGIPTFVHSCGPEKELVKMAVENTKLTMVNPLEAPPMGDCNLAELKKKYGDKIILMGNLHTTDIMLRGSVNDVIEASKKAIDDAASGGGFILGCGDQCGRDTPDENLFAMVDTARSYGKY